MSSNLVMSAVLENFYIFVGVTGFILFVRYHWIRRKLYMLSWKCNGPFAWPIVGNFLQMGRSMDEVTDNINNIVESYPSIQRLWFFNKLLLCLSTPEHIHIALNNPKSFKKADFFYEVFITVVGTGLFSAPVDMWKVHRKIINPTFNQKILNTFMDVFNERSIVFNQVLRKRIGTGEFDIFDPMCLCTLDIICESIMGIKVDAQHQTVIYLKTIQRTMEISMIQMFDMFIRFEFFFNRSKVGKEAIEKRKLLHNFVKSIIIQKREEVNQRKTEMYIENTIPDEIIPKRKAFLEYLLEEEKFTDQELIYHVHTFITGGSDTSGTSMSSTCLLLAINQEVQDKAYAELYEIFGDSDRYVTLEDLTRMDYLERVFKESLRLVPITFGVGRETTDEISLGSITVPAGVSLFINMLSVHRNPKYWPDPLKFDPDRFLPEEIAKRHPGAWIPFSSGARNCIGLKFAMMSMKVVMANLLREFKLTTSYKRVEDIKLEWHLIMKVVDGCRVSLEPRNRQRNT